MPHLFEADLLQAPEKPKPDIRWSVIADDLKKRQIPGWENAFTFIKHFSLTVCGGVVWRPLHEPSKPANDIDIIASDQISLRSAIASIPSYNGDTILTKTRFGGDRVTWTKPVTGSLDIWVVTPDLLMTFVAGLRAGKRTIWTPFGVVLDLDPPGVVPEAGFVEPYNVVDDQNRGK